MNANTNTNTEIDTDTYNNETDTNINNINTVNTVNIVNESNIQNPVVIVEKKKRGRKKTIKTDIVLPTTSEDNTTNVVTEKKIRKRRSKKNMAIAKALASASASASASETDNINSIETTDLKEVVPGVKVRKRRVCKSKNNKNLDTSDGTNTDTNVIIDSNNPEIHPPEEKVVKKRGRKPKGGKIITQKLEENNNNNEMPNIILHLKCSLGDINNKNNDNSTSKEVEKNEIQSYTSSQLKGSDIYIKNEQSNTESKKSCGSSGSGSGSGSVYGDSLSHLFKVYNPALVSTDAINNETNTSTLTSKSITNNEILNQRSGLFNNVYSPDVNLYSTDYDDGDDGDSVTGTCKSEKEIWRKINQLKVSFHKSDICKNIGGTQRSACFWCTCEFDSPAIYIPKILTKDVYNVYGCFCSPECSAAFLMNENIDTSTKFERYHLLNLLYGKIYKYEKSIKVAPNPFYLLNKFYGNLTIQEYRKLFQSDQMIYVVNKPLTHILPELYEDNNDFLLNNKIIPTNSVNIKKNKPLKSNIINNAFGIKVGDN
jgi:hypothetical protein